MDDGSSVTFHADGTGIYTDPNEESTGGKLMRRSATRGAYTLPFTYSYEEEDNSIFIHTENETLQLFIVTLTDDRAVPIRFLSLIATRRKTIPFLSIRRTKRFSSLS